MLALGSGSTSKAGNGAGFCPPSSPFPHLGTVPPGRASHGATELVHVAGSWQQGLTLAERSHGRRAGGGGLPWLSRGGGQLQPQLSLSRLARRCLPPGICTPHGESGGPQINIENGRLDPGAKGKVTDIGVGGSARTGGRAPRAPFLPRLRSSGAQGLTGCHGSWELQAGGGGDTGGEGSRAEKYRGGVLGGVESRAPARR